MVDQRGEILLNYVRPDARFSGISKAILRALEDFARGKRIQRCFLQSTKTAKTFYESCGYSTFDDASLNLEKKL
jgi:N-acetylglutamate synthase-like GNAT family acetyltransferase